MQLGDIRRTKLHREKSNDIYGVSITDGVTGDFRIYSVVLRELHRSIVGHTSKIFSSQVIPGVDVNLWNARYIKAFLDTTKKF